MLSPAAQNFRAVITHHKGDRPCRFISFLTGFPLAVGYFLC
nr:MAG TPA: hypothetical protein [Ackermannviridae sp.]